MKIKKLSVFILAVLFSGPSYSQVMNSNPQGFSIKIESTTDGSPAKLYKQFVHIKRWWISDHTWFGSSKKLSLKPQAGGCFCEISGANQVKHMEVVYVKKDHEIRLKGELGPLQSMGGNGIMIWKFIPEGTDKTKIIQTYHYQGMLGEQASMIAKAVDQVQSQQQQALINSLKSKD